MKLREFGHSLPMELLKAREAAMARFRPMLRRHGLTEQQWRVIRVLAEYRRIDASELARRSLLLAPSLSRIFQFLEREQLIKRTADARDQRRSLFTLTAKGRALHEQVAPESEALYAQIEAEFGGENLDSLYELLANFQEALAK
jgi:homoprotocatechuate degradation regulator HpaR